MCSYRQDERHVHAAVDLIEQTLANFKEQLDARSTLQDRAVFSLEVIQDLIDLLGGRARDCVEQHPTISCENLDMFDLLSDWASHAKTRLAVSQD